MSDFFSLKAKDASQNIVNFSDFKGKTLIISNVATECGLTKSNYESFKYLIEKYYDKDLRILLFPCSQFLNQESQNIDIIKEFANSFSDKFIVFDKVNVFGKDKHPVFEYLTENGKGTFFNFVKWNFTKWIVKDGKVIKRIGPKDLVKEEDLNM